MILEYQRFKAIIFIVQFIWQNRLVASRNQSNT